LIEVFLKPKELPGTKKIKKIGKVPIKPFDLKREWGYSDTKKEWIYGYRTHLAVTVSKKTSVFPFFAALTRAKVKGIIILKKKFFPLLPKQTK
jgi:hypothetical protein